MSLSVRQVRYFIAVADSGQISRAAIHLNVSQSAITAAIKNLEETLSTTLFERKPNGVTLTYEGHQFLNHARHIVAAVEEAMRLPSRVREDIRGRFRLVMTYTVAGYFLPPYLARFSRAFPNITIELSEADRDDVEDGLIAGRYDLAMMLTSNLVNQEYIAHNTLIRSRRRLWVAADHPFLKRDSVSLQDVAHQPYILLSVDEASNTAQRYWNRTPYRPKPLFRTSSVEAVRSMVANGSGVAILSDLVYRPWSLEGRRVEVITLADPVPTMDVGPAWPNRVELNPAARAFVDFMHLAIGGESSSAAHV